MANQNAKGIKRLIMHVSFQLQALKQRGHMKKLLDKKLLYLLFQRL